MFSMIDIGERAGSGIPGVFSVWHKTFGASPEYSQRTSPDRITTTLILADYLDGFADNPVEKTRKTVEKTENTVEKTENTVEKKNSTLEKIIALIMHNPQITVKEISSLLNITRRGIEEQIKTLKSKGLIRRIGADKNGHWEIL